jgi:hypothetical protein
MYGCVNVLDKNGNDTTYDQFFISHCTAVSVTNLCPILNYIDHISEHL